MNIIPSSGKKKLPSAIFYCAVFDMHEKSPEKNMANVTPPPPPPSEKQNQLLQIK